MECCDLSQLFKVEWLSTKSGDRSPHSKEHQLSPAQPPSHNRHCEDNHDQGGYKYSGCVH